MPVTGAVISHEHRSRFPAPTAVRTREHSRSLLASKITAARAAAYPHLPLAAFAAELRDARQRLSALDGGDPASNLRAVFSWSYQQLSEEAADLFQLLGIHPGPDISLPAAASLAGTSRHRPALRCRN
ncbi:MAG: hypothetical protein JO242_13520 [Streptosporangiaceae bacterium]|nr:hypothetical protein [Streptosporangiaceae bacterium]